MSRKSSGSNALVAGIIGAGVGVLAAGVFSYAIRASSPRNNSSQIPQRRASRQKDNELVPDQQVVDVASYANKASSPSNNPSKISKRRVGRQTDNEKIRKQQENEIKLSNQEEQSESSGCSICGKSLTSEPSITLDCRHSYHKKCLFSSYVVQTQISSAKTFRCPMSNCQDMIGEEVLESILFLN